MLSPTAGAGEAAALALLGRVFAREIDVELLRLLRDPHVAGHLASTAPAAAQCLSRPWTEADYDAAAQEYCRLFIVPQIVPPMAGAWLAAEDANGGARIGAAATAVAAALELELPAELAQLPSEHVSVLLAISGWLRAQGHPAADDFVARTLRPWLGHFAASLRRSSDSALYRAFGDYLSIAL